MTQCTRHTSGAVFKPTFSGAAAEKGAVYERTGHDVCACTPSALTHAHTQTHTLTHTRLHIHIAHAQTRTKHLAIEVRSNTYSHQALATAGHTVLAGRSMTALRCGFRRHSLPHCLIQAAAAAVAQSLWVL